MNEGPSDTESESAKDVALADLLFSVISAISNQSLLNNEILEVVAEISRHDPSLTERLEKLLAVARESHQQKSDILAKMKAYLSV